MGFCENLPIGVLGFHRSGTSMIARLLNLCGVYLGAEQDIMMPAADDNPDGYWEHLQLALINNELLAALGGSWSKPPILNPGWEMRADLEPFRERARNALAELQTQPLWGWKDPRNSLTLPFWLMLVPDLQLVCTLRNPLEVAASMSKGTTHRKLTPNAALALWVAYYEHLLKVARPESLIVTHFDTYFYDPVAELGRVLEQLSIASSGAQIEAACRSINTESRHNLSASFLLNEPALPTDTLRTYHLLTAHAGTVYERMIADTPYQTRQWQVIISSQQNQIFAQATQLILSAEQNARLAAENAQISQQNLELSALNGQVTGQYAALEDHARALQNALRGAVNWSATLQSDLTGRMAEIEIARNHIESLTARLNAIPPIVQRICRFVRSLGKALSIRR